MKPLIFLPLILIFGTVLNAETFTTLEGDKYENASIRQVDPDGLLIRYADGVVKLKFKNLPAEIGAKYGYNAANAAEYEAIQRSNSVASYQAAMKVLLPSQQVTKPNVTNAGAQALNVTNAGAQAPGIITTPSNSISVLTLLKAFIKNYSSMIKQLFSVQVTSTPTPTPTSTPTPEQIVSEILNRDSVDANDLSRIFNNYPALTIKLLGEKNIRIAGNIECIRVSGMESEKSEIELKNSYLKKIILIENLKENIVVDNKATSNVSFKLLNDQLYIITKKNSASVAYAPRYYYNNGYYYNGYYGNISTVPRDNEFGPPKLYVTKGERLENKYVKMRNHDSYGIQFTVLPTQ